MKKITWLLFAALLSYAIWQITVSMTSAQAIKQWSETEATVLDTRTRVKRKSIYTYAKVSFKAADEKVYETQVKLIGLPFFGASLSKNDNITLLYDPEQPVIVKSPNIDFLDSYGLYILIVVGVIISLIRILKGYAQKPAS